MADLIVSATVLRWARESYGLEVNEAADLARTSPQQIAVWEAGDATPTLPELKRLADAYDRQLATLLLREAPTEDEPRLPDFRRRPGYNPPRLSQGVHRAIREVRRQQLALAEIASDLGLHPVPVASVQAEHAEALATYWRERLGLSVEDQARLESTSAALRAWRELVERAGSLVAQLNFGEEDIRGFSIADATMPAIALNSGDSDTGRSFTLFHELAHLLIGRVGLCQPTSALRFEPESQAEERFCNHFAGALLVPIDALRQNRWAKEIADRHDLPGDSDFTPLRNTFKVSAQVLWYRLREAGLVDQARYYALWSYWASLPPPQPRSGGVPQDRSQRAISRYGRGFVSAVIEAERRGFIDFGDVLNYTRVRGNEVTRLAALAAGEA